MNSYFASSQAQPAHTAHPNWHQAGPGRANARKRAAAMVVLAALSASSNASIIEGMPDAIVCSVSDPTGVLPWERLVYYVSAQMVDGATLFKTLTSDPVVLLVSTAGIVNAANLADCDGRSVSSLIEEGRAFTLGTEKPARTSARD